MWELCVKMSRLSSLVSHGVSGTGSNGLETFAMHLRNGTWNKVDEDHQTQASALLARRDNGYGTQRRRLMQGREPVSR